MSKLKEFGCIETEATSKFTVVTLCNWQIYQDVFSESSQNRRTSDGQPTDERRTSDGQPVTDEQRNKEIKEQTNTPVFRPPTVAEVEAFADLTHRLNPNWPVEPLVAQDFVDHYASQGWVTGTGVPIQDWKSKVRLWGNRARKRGKSNESKESCLLYTSDAADE